MGTASLVLDAHQFVSNDLRNLLCVCTLVAQWDGFVWHGPPNSDAVKVIGLRGLSTVMAVSIVISQLTKRYGRLLGIYSVADRYIEGFEGLKAIQEATVQIDEYKLELKTQMSEIAGSIRQFDPSFQITSIRLIRPKRQLFANGSVSKVVYATLREEARPLKTREISRLVAEKMGLPVEERVLFRFDALIYNALIRRVGATVTVEGEPKEWALIPRDLVGVRNAEIDSEREQN